MPDPAAAGLPSELVLSRAALAGRGVTRAQLRTELAANRWQRWGAAIVLHNGPLSRDQRWLVGLLNVGPRCMLTAFTAAELLGLRGWEREEIHVLAPPGSSSRAVPGLRIRVHRSRGWPPAADPPAADALAVNPSGLRCQPAAPAVVVAAGTFATALTGCGMLAAAVRQRIVASEAIERSLLAAVRLRHRAVLLAAVRDMAGGPRALDGIDLPLLCRRHGLPPPGRQLLRPEPSGRRRYLHAGWSRADGRLVVVEVDGALQLSRRQWWAEPERAPEFVAGGATVLRFASAVVRAEPRLVAEQLRRALRLPEPASQR
jgi:hypothetical protein